jgi:hypothetical protein
VTPLTLRVLVVNNEVVSADVEEDDNATVNIERDGDFFLIEIEQ